MIPEELKAYLKETSVCPLCQSSDFKTVFDLPNMKVAECRKCRFRFTNPHLSEKGMGLLYENSDFLTEINPALSRYYEYEVGKGNSLTRRDYLKVLQFAEKHLGKGPEKRHFFEVGFGSGNFLLQAKERGWRVDGIDTSHENCRRLIDEKGVTVRYGMFGDYDLPENHYNLLVFWDVIEHTIDPGFFLKTAYKMLKPNGLLVIAAPNINGLLNRTAEMLHFLSGGRLRSAPEKLYVMEHVGYFNPRSLSRLIQLEGFRIVKLLASETDLDRYDFKPFLKLSLKVLFLFARLLRMQNRMILIAEKI